MSDRAKKKAGKLRSDLGLADRWIDLEGLLREMEVEVRYEPLLGELEGLTQGDLILVDPSYGENRRRFTLGHELGHYLLGHLSCSCESNVIHGKPGIDTEREANAFAASLLMPTRSFRRDARKVAARFEELDKLGNAYGVSRTAAAIRFVELSRDLCALIGMRLPKRPWITKSWDRGWWLRLPPEPETLVSRCESGVDEPGSGDVPARVWFEEYPWDTELHVREEVVQTSDKSWLALLSEIPDPDEDPEVVEREIDQELDRRRRSFRRY